MLIKINPIFFCLVRSFNSLKNKKKSKKNEKADTFHSFFDSNWKKSSDKIKSWETIKRKKKLCARIMIRKEFEIMEKVIRHIDQNGKIVLNVKNQRKWKKTKR